MRIGIISDAHGNDTGLKICIDYLKSESVDKIIFLGDIGDYCPNAKNVFEILQENNCQCILGNHDEMLTQFSSTYYFNDVFKIEKTIDDLGIDNINIIRKFPDQLILKTEKNKQMIFMHVGEDGVYSDQIFDRWVEMGIIKIKPDFMFHGHTHIPKISILTNNKKIINVGSCGLSRDFGNLLSTVIFDTITEEIKINRIEFDSESFIRENFEKLDSYVINCFRRRGKI